MRINPRLYQAMDLLYMPLLDLQQHLKQELLNNPFLELIEPDEETTDQASAKEQLEQEKSKKEEENDWENLLLDGFETPGGRKAEFEVREFYEPTPVAARDLIDHLRDQITLLELTDRARFLAEEFLGNIEDDGYLAASLEEMVAGANRALDEVAQGVETGLDVERFTVPEAEQVLRAIQHLDPPGVGARDLRECLLLQLEEAGVSDGLAYRLVRDAWDDLKAHRWSELAKRFGLEPRAVQQAADVLAKYDPKPGLRYTAAPDGYIVPDLIVDKIDGRYQVFLNDTGLPRLRLSPVYQQLARDKGKFTGENKEFVSQRLNSATWMIQAIEQRRQTMLKVMNFIVDRQRDFFEKGVEYLKPLTLREVAEVISMHESTVSRVTNEKFVQTPRGVFPLKFFFSSGLETTSGEDASARSIKAQLQKLVHDEEESRPLTDQQIVEIFKDRGVKIARRTVAKYRDQLHILPARMRKRL
jgi:RNA polymerase sigma-54 factor